MGSQPLSQHRRWRLHRPCLLAPPRLLWPLASPCPPGACAAWLVSPSALSALGREPASSGPCSLGSPSDPPRSCSPPSQKTTVWSPGEGASRTQPSPTPGLCPRCFPHAAVPGLPTTGTDLLALRPDPPSHRPGTPPWEHTHVLGQLRPGPLSRPAQAAASARRRETVDREAVFTAVQEPRAAPGHTGVKTHPEAGVLHSGGTLGSSQGEPGWGQVGRSVVDAPKKAGCPGAKGRARGALRGGTRPDHGMLGPPSLQVTSWRPLELQRGDPSSTSAEWPQGPLVLSSATWRSSTCGGLWHP